MLVTFKTKSYANITMFGEVGKKMLEMIGFGVDIPGAIIAADVPQALQNLKKNLEAVRDIVDPVSEEDDDQPAVSLHTRSVPLVALLQSAVDDENDVMWE